MKNFLTSLPLRLWWWNWQAKTGVLHAGTRLAERMLGRSFTDEKKEKYR